MTTVRFIYAFAYLVMGAFAVACNAKPIDRDNSISIACLLKYENGRPVRSEIRTIYRFNLRNLRGIYFYDVKLPKHDAELPKTVSDFEFFPDYLWKPRNYIYWEIKNAILGRPEDSYTNFNINDDKEEALMLFYERYRYSIKTRVLEMLSRGFTNWDRGMASKTIYYRQNTASSECSEIDILQ